MHAHAERRSGRSTWRAGGVPSPRWPNCLQLAKQCSVSSASSARCPQSIPTRSKAALAQLSKCTRAFFNLGLLHKIACGCTEVFVSLAAVGIKSAAGNGEYFKRFLVRVGARRKNVRASMLSPAHAGSCAQVLLQLATSYSCSLPPVRTVLQCMQG